MFSLKQMLHSRAVMAFAKTKKKEENNTRRTWRGKGEKLLVKINCFLF